MTPPPEDPFFPPDWRAQVLAFVEPYELDEPFDNSYSVSIVRQNWYDNGFVLDDYLYWEATLRLGNIFIEGLEMSGFGGGGQESTVVLYARKAVFQSPLHFWACATLIYSPMDMGDGPTTWGYLSTPYNRSRALNASEFRLLLECQWPRYYLKGKLVQPLYPLPAVFEEPVLRAWHCAVEWNKHFTWGETSDSLVMWKWRTTV